MDQATAKHLPAFASDSSSGLTVAQHCRLEILCSMVSDGQYPELVAYGGSSDTANDELRSRIVQRACKLADTLIETF